MIEQRPFYHAFTGTTDVHSSHESAIPTPDQLVQYAIDGAVSRDAILLLPILQSAVYGDETPEVCMQLVHLLDGKLGFCNRETVQHCACCDASICEKHHLRGFLTLLDDQGAITTHSLAGQPVAP